MFTMALGDKLHLVPIGLNPQNILDIGTGTGIWCMQMGVFPAAIISFVARIRGS